MDKLRFMDFHCDTITRGKGLCSNGYHIDLERIPADWDWCQAFAVFVPDEYRGQAAFEFFTRSAAFFRRQMEAHGEIIRQVRSPQEIGDALAQGLRAAILTVEGGAALAGKLENLDVLWEEGVRMMTLTWNGVNEIGSGNASHEGLTPFGRAVVSRMEELGMVVDVSHLNDEGVSDVARMARRPFAASHSDSRAVRNHSRNLTDDQFRVIRDMGGLVGINFAAVFLSDVEMGCTSVAPGQMMEHILHFLDLGGEDCLALGSDFDGADMPDFIGNVAGLASLREVMLQSGLGPCLTDKILFQNGMDFWKRYENLR